jgi:hypothetical protein
MKTFQGRLDDALMRLMNPLILLLGFFSGLPALGQPDPPPAGQTRKAAAPPFRGSSNSTWQADEVAASALPNNNKIKEAQPPAVTLPSATESSFGIRMSVLDKAL